MGVPALCVINLLEPECELQNKLLEPQFKELQGKMGFLAHGIP